MTSKSPKEDLTTTTIKPRTSTSSVTIRPTSKKTKESNTIDSPDNDEFTQPFNNLLDRVIGFSKNIDTGVNEAGIEKTFEQLKDLKNPDNDRKKDDEDKITILYSYLIDTFSNNLDYVIKDFDELKKIQKFHDESTKLHDKYTKNLEKLKQKINLEKRRIEYNKSEYNKMVYETNILKYYLLFILCLFIIPILRLTNILTRGSSILLFFSALFIGIATFTYLVYTNNKNRDNVFFDKLDFKKPDLDENSKLKENCNLEDNKEQEKEDKEKDQQKKDKKWKQYLKYEKEGTEESEKCKKETEEDSDDNHKNHKNHKEEDHWYSKWF